MFTTWLGDMITDRGIGNGISMIIMAGIIARVPDGIRQVFVEEFQGSSRLVATGILYIVILLLAILAIVTFVTYVQQAKLHPATVKLQVVAKKVKRLVAKVRLGFEGGQMPLFRRMPKRGFNNINRKEYAIVNLETLNKFEDGAEATPALMVEAGIVKNEKIWR